MNEKLKLSPETLLELINIFRQGFVGNLDMSQRLRDLELKIGISGQLELTDEYIRKFPRSKEY